MYPTARSGLGLESAPLALILWLAGYLAKAVLNRRRLADWEQAWRTVEPRWTCQR